MKIFGKYKKLFATDNGFSLIEILLLIVVVGIAASTALQWMTDSIEDIRTVNTEREMEMLAEAINGDPVKLSNGKRSDFGYIGDIGAFPPNLQALYENPGGYATWDGPYIADDFTQDSTRFKFDEWGVAYNYGGGITIASTGSGTTISKKIADASNDYLLNRFNGVIKDSAGNVPGTTYLDSVDVVVTIPNGSGSAISKTYNPDSAGTFTLDSLPVGHHPLRIIYTPNIDTIYRKLVILPRNKSNQTYKFATVYFDTIIGGSGVEILRPVGVGNSGNLLTQNCSNNWQCVDETVSDDDDTYVKGAGSQWKLDTYETANHSAGTGTVDSIIVYVKAKGSGGGKKARTAIRIGGNNYTGSQNNTTGSYVDYSTTYLTNPATSAAWTWTDIDNLEIGVDLKKVAFCTQVWVEVYYTY
jgi:type II secretory pathway pseudopilin PulG